MQMTYCPNCRTDIRDDLHRCPACTSWLTRESRPAAITFGTIVGGVLVGQLIAGAILVLVLALFGSALSL